MLITKWLRVWAFGVPLMDVCCQSGGRKKKQTKPASVMRAQPITAWRPHWRPGLSCGVGSAWKLTPSGFQYPSDCISRLFSPAPSPAISGASGPALVPHTMEPLTGRRGSLPAPPAKAQIFTQAIPPYLITSVNKEWEALCGYSAAEVVGRTCAFLQGPETSYSALEVLMTAIHAGQSTTVQLINYKKSRETFINRLTVEPILDVTGQLGGFAGTLVPISKDEACCAAAPAAADGSCARSDAANGKVPQGAVDERSSAAATELLSRSTFPLQTLNNHPAAPVRLPQLLIWRDCAPFSRPRDCPPPRATIMHTYPAPFAPLAPSAGLASAAATQ